MFHHGGGTDSKDANEMMLDIIRHQIKLKTQWNTCTCLAKRFKLKTNKLTQKTKTNNPTQLPHPKLTIPNAGKDSEHLEISMAQSLRKTVWQPLMMLNIHFIYIPHLTTKPSIPHTLNHLLKRNEGMCPRKRDWKMNTYCSFIHKAKSWEHHKRPSTGKWINKFW